MSAARSDEPVPRFEPISTIPRNVPDGSNYQDLNLDTPGWKRRKRAIEGPDTTICPSKMNAVDACLMNANDRGRAGIFAPVEGTTFDSCQEAYELYNLFSWVHGFGIKHGMPMATHEIV